MSKEREIVTNLHVHFKKINNGNILHNHQKCAGKNKCVARVKDILKCIKNLEKKTNTF